MAKEIERKFIISKDIPLEGLPFSSIEQGYLSTDPNKTVRVRIKDTTAFLTIKGRTEGITRDEFEYTIPIDDAKQLLKMTSNKINKKRYYYHNPPHLWEIDIFEDENRGLYLAEVELNESTEEVILPQWIIKEVSGEDKYYNSQLCISPFTSWSNEP
ncbi:CYTH domain-containing protein [Halosquirtibacter xylanolyticus]|uniref:CYTH domain-containing protein n=1 Tax=Halosquirtibacter xylanolyticus TaxID=3374599 RepID=UPI00374A13C7|nr:CYTH domain-containing protein [Prolixibacteraceae bacterium]